jgi:hypothetical protein
MTNQTETVYDIFYKPTWSNKNNDDPMYMNAIDEMRNAGYTFISDGTWYAKGTEAVLLYHISGGDQRGEVPLLKTVEDYIENGDTNYSGMFGGWCEKDSEQSGNADNVNYSDGWDTEGCGYAEFDIYKNGKLVRKATSMTEEDWEKGKAVKEYATSQKLD